MAINTILWLVGIFCAIWVVYDVLVKNQELSVGKKALWIIAALLFSIITAIVYYFIYKK